MRKRELLLGCEEMIKSFDPTRTTVDAHVDDKLGVVKDGDKLFMQQVFYGCVRYKQALKIVLSHFYHDNSGRTSRNDYTMYLVLGYVVLFRLEEIGLKELESLVAVNDASKMHTFLEYVTNGKQLHEALKPEWIRILDTEFIMTHVIGTIEKKCNGIQKILKHLHGKAYGGISSTASLLKNTQDSAKLSNKPLTIPVAPQLTKPKPRKIDEPMRIGQESIANPVPDLNKVTLADINEKNKLRKLETHALTEQKYKDSAVQPFQFNEIRSNLDQIKEQVEQERKSQVNFDGFKAKPAPKHKEATSSVKLNLAAVLREDALYKKKQEQEAQLIKNYESELRDSTEFYRWQTQKLKEDEEKEKDQVEYRRLEMVKSQQEAIEASLRAKRENKRIASTMRQASKQGEILLQQEKEMAEAENRIAMEEIKKHRELAPREAEDKIKEQNQIKRNELKDKLAQEWKLKKQQDAIEQERRQDLIRQIRALDLVHREHVAVFDPTESSNLGLLDEMSLVELRERLALQKVKTKQAEEEKRSQILSSKSDKENALRQRLETISKFRKTAAATNRSTRARRKDAEEKAKLADKRRRDSGNLALAKKLQKQREDRDAETIRLQQEENEIMKQRMFLGAEKSMIEKKHFEELQRGAERQARERQKEVQVAAALQEDIQNNARELRQKIKLENQLKNKKLNREKEKLLQVQMIERKLKDRQAMLDRQEIVKRERAHASLQTSLQRKRNQYATERSDRSIHTGKLVMSMRNTRQVPKP